MGRVGRPEELAAAVLFLASDQSSFITGIELFVDGGQSDLKPRKIRVNAISPGPIDTPAIDQLAGSPDNATQFKANMAASVPLGRLGLPDEIAKAATFLASDDSSFITGIELFVDGGMAQV